jgi:endonuclease/exonuclease/phosphatase family metal-dependent hydrolase
MVLAGLHRMKLISWNIQWCRGCDGRVDPSRIVEHARRVADFDVLCLQEVAANFSDLEGSAGENQFDILARLLPGYTAVPGAAVDIAGAGAKRKVFGNMIFSRLPVERALRWQLPWPGNEQHEGMPRMVIEATLRTPLGALRVMTTHLEYYSSRQRAAQVDALRALHAEAAGRARDWTMTKETGPFAATLKASAAILTGDFNFKPDDPLRQTLQSSYDDGTPALRDAWVHAHPGRAHAHTLGVHDHKKWADPYTSDYLFVTEDLLPRLRRVEVDTVSDASDHQPMLLELE